MKKLITFTLTLFLFTVGNIYAQVSETADAELSVRADIQGTFSIAQTTSLDFGTVAAGATASVDANESDDAGLLTVTASSDGNYFFDLPTTVTLTDGEEVDPETIEVNLTFVGDNESGNQSTANDDLSGQVAISGGNYYLWVGGNFTTPTSQSSGEYTGTATISISDTSF